MKAGQSKSAILWSWDQFGCDKEQCLDPDAVTCAHCDLGVRAFCAGLSNDQFRRFVAVLGQASVEAQGTVFREGDQAQNIYTITAGAVKLYKLLSDGRRQIIGFYFPGDFFGFSDSGHYAYTAEAMLPLMVCRFPRAKLDALFAEIPVLEKKVLRVATQELAAAHDQILLLGRKTARERLASFVLSIWKRLGCADDPSAPVTLPMGRADIADFLGLTIETVSRTFTALRQEGLIGLPDTSHLVIRQAEVLRRIAEGY